MCFSFNGQVADGINGDCWSERRLTVKATWQLCRIWLKREMLCLYSNKRTHSHSMFKTYTSMEVNTLTHSHTTTHTHGTWDIHLHSCPDLHVLKKTRKFRQTTPVSVSGYPSAAAQGEKWKSGKLKYNLVLHWLWLCTIPHIHMHRNIDDHHLGLHWQMDEHSTERERLRNLKSNLARLFL